MATVKLFLEPHETEAEATDSIVKALLSHGDGMYHREDFQQAVARDVVARLEKEHADLWESMLREIFQVIDAAE